MKKPRFVEDIKTLKANHKTLREFAKEKYLDETGTALIHIYVEEKDLFNPLSNPQDPSIAPEIVDYIENEAHFIPYEYPLKVVFHSKEVLPQERLTAALKQHYWKTLADKDDDLKNNRIISVVLLLVGVILLSLSILLGNIPGVNAIFAEILSIAATFTIWEAVDYFLLNRNALKISYLNYAQLALLQVEIKQE